jgi:para-aminobenzoate synthetase/4-amino-4-deoxychorismate lyase
MMPRGDPSEGADVADSINYELLETLLLDRGRFTLRERHLERLLASARTLGFAATASAIDAALDALAAQLPSGRWRVRLCVARDGSVRLEHYPLAPAPITPQPIALATQPIDRHDPFLAHKTTYRAVYDAHRAQFPNAFDVLLWNQDGELTEFTIGNLVVELDGQRLTPALSCGLLPGTLRAELLVQGAIHEAVLDREALARASRLWLINSVRGWCEVVWQPPTHNRSATAASGS